MRLSRAVLDRYTKAVNGISGSARSAMEKELLTLDWSDATSAIDECVRIVEAYTSASADAAGALASAFYDEVRVQEIGEASSAEYSTGHDQAATEQIVRASAQKAVEGDVAGFYRELSARVAYETSRAAGEAVSSKAVNDSVGVRFARVPSGSETCSFCIMLAGRGFVYATKRSAGEGNHYHDNCDCRVVPNFDGKSEVEGYESEEYRDIYEHPERHPEVTEARNARRRELYAERKAAQAGQAEQPI